MKGITDLLLMSIHSDTPEKRVSFDCLQHPFIVLLKADMENWAIIELQLELMFDFSYAFFVTHILYSIYLHANVIVVRVNQKVGPCFSCSEAIFCIWTMVTK